MGAREAAMMGKTANTTVPVSGTVPLTMIGIGESRKVCLIRGRDDTRRHLANLGFSEDAEVSVISELGGNLIVSVKGARVAVGRAMAAKILVR